MSVYSYMTADPYNLPIELIDLINLNETEFYNMEKEEFDTTDDENKKVLVSVLWPTIKTALFSPVYLLLHLMDSWTEDRVKKIIRKTNHLRQNKRI